MKYIILTAIFLAIAGCGAAPQEQSERLVVAHCQDHSGLQDSSCTPGATFANVTTAQICTAGYAQSVRNVPQSEKDAVFAEYGVVQHTPGAYEVDHLVSLELGGSNDIKNLWPQPYTGPYNAHMKDALENFLHSQVCSGSLQLQCAQKAISNDWINAYNEMIQKYKMIC